MFEMLLRSESSLIILLIAGALQPCIATPPNSLPKSRSKPMLDSRYWQFFTDANKYGFPIPKNDEPDNESPTVCKNYLYFYDKQRKDPVWVMEYLTNETVRDRIYLNDLTPESGHAINRLIMDPDICSSNVFPQLPALNRGPWMSLEKYVEALALRTENVRIVTGSYYSSKGSTARLMDGIQLTGPSKFYKVILSKDSNGKFALESFLMPYSQDEDGHKSLNEFRYDIDDLERMTGLKFFRKLARSGIKQRATQFGLSDKLDAWRDYILEPTISQKECKSIPPNGKGRRSNYAASSSGRSSSSRQSRELTSDDDPEYITGTTELRETRKSSPLHDIIKKFKGL